MFYFSGLLWLLMDPSIICGEMTDGYGDNSYSYDDYYHNYTYVYDEEILQNQNYLYHYLHCNETRLRILGETECWNPFNVRMDVLGEEHWCNMKTVISIYSVLMDCMEAVSKDSYCYYPNAVVEHLYVEIHQQYFRFCSDGEVLTDAPAGVVLAATLLPILLIPFVVYIVVWKSSLRD